MAEFQCPRCESTRLYVDGTRDVTIAFDGITGNTGAIIDGGDIVEARDSRNDYCGCRDCHWGGEIQEARNAANLAAGEEDAWIEEEEAEEEEETPADFTNRDEGGVV